MKIRLPRTVRIRLKRMSKQSALDRRLYRRLNRVFRQYRDSLKQPSMAQLKRELSIERIIAHSLGREPETIRGESRWHCVFHADANPSLWGRDLHSSGRPRWGCNPCGLSGDLFDFVMLYHVLPLKGALIYLRRHIEDFTL